MYRSAPPTQPPGQEPELGSHHLEHQALQHGVGRIRAALGSLDHDDRDRTVDLLRWVDELRDGLHRHHPDQDHGAFTALAERVPIFEPLAADLAALEARLHRLVSELGGALAEHAEQAEPVPLLLRASRLAVEIEECLALYLQLEERDVLPLFARHFDDHELRALGIAAGPDQAPRSPHPETQPTKP